MPDVIQTSRLIADRGQPRFLKNGLIADDFTAPDGTSLIGRRTPFGGRSWVVAGAGATAEIVGGNLRMHSGSGRATVSVGTPSPFGTLRTVVGPLGTQPTLRVFISYRDETNGTYLGRVGSGNNTYRLFNLFANSATAIGGTTAKVITPGDVIEITRLNASIVVKVNGVTIITSSSASYQGDLLRAYQVGTAGEVGTEFTEFSWTPA